MTVNEIAAKINAIQADNPDIALRVVIQKTTIRVVGWGRADAQYSKELTYTALDAGGEALLDDTFLDVIEHLR